tara:strand:- start:41721 stop:43019 length:1299 start_codon:yes stop_codon:yes gene_type:complete
MSPKKKMKRDLRYYTFKDIDLKFLIFLILITQGNIPVKIFAVFFIMIFRLRPIFVGHQFILFYYFILVYHIVYGLFLIAFKSINYWPNYLLSFLFWMVSYITLSQIAFFVKNWTLVKIYKTIDFFFLVNIFVILIQLINSMFLFQTLNPYGVSNSAGDLISSIYSNSSVNFVIMSFFSIMYLLRKKWFYGILSVIFLLMTTYMSGVVLFLASLVVGIYLFSSIKLKSKIFIAIGSFFLIFLFSQIAPSNITYASRYLIRIWENGEDTPFKIKSFFQTFEYWTSSITSFIFGAGGGSFSSRIAFIASGDYVGWFPDSLTYASDEFKKYHLNIWTYDFNNPWDNRNNTANQPFSFYNQIIGEYGLIGLLIFILFYLGYFFRKWQMLSYSKFLLIALGGYFLLDYWFEYFSVIIIFELLVLVDVKERQNITSNEI